MTRNYLLSISLLIVIGMILSACAQKPSEFGTLEGHVSIGPLTPVERVGEPTPTPNPEVYASREIVIYEDDGKTEVTRIPIGVDGSYQAQLPAGSYFVDINHSGFDSAKGLPAKVEITDQGVTRLDIDIDTGIR